ncbi:uncharacterized protein CLUP02_17530 [Colletotrichum lupini]|uniref:Uncharacterized protein n=1 Tax=Colletotrichum lupini TaxID=145971 RepID=A0A9Q8SEX2_9PEZI|nr:uncharacterized protein CLUP02_17530 [Colletotrichum lupini]UQC76019.1 hypothetical protein CLUP02_17530 [Colletotrichum lupini]
MPGLRSPSCLAVVNPRPHSQYCLSTQRIRPPPSWFSTSVVVPRIGLAAAIPAARESPHHFDLQDPTPIF